MAAQLIGVSPAFKEVLDAIAMVGSVDSAVLLLGETGTGKEVVAQAIHAAGPRRHQRFVAVNCAAIPASLLESELFGHERGAFTGAVSQAIGRFQAADQGTLFLDEVGDLPLELQPKLLRALQERQIERLGSGGRTLSVDVRVIAATNQDLESMVRLRTFRADLFYRLNVVPIRVPPLRERAEDIPLLITHFVSRFAERQGKVVKEVPEEVVATLKNHSWPGNVRELQNVIERAVVATSGPTLRLPGAERRIDHRTPSSRTLAQVERDHIVATLQATNGVLGGWDGAAARLGLPRTTLISRMQRLGISAGTTPAGRGCASKRDEDRRNDEDGQRVPGKGGTGAGRPVREWKPERDHVVRGQRNSGTAERANDSRHHEVWRPERVALRCCDRTIGRARRAAPGPRSTHRSPRGDGHRPR